MNCLCIISVDFNLQYNVVSIVLPWLPFFLLSAVIWACPKLKRGLRVGRIIELRPCCRFESVSRSSLATRNH